MSINYEKNWQFAINVGPYFPTSDVDATRYQLWALKASLKGELGGLTGSGLWTHVSSSDSVTTSTGSDLWGSTYDGTKIVRSNTVARSWIVLQSPSGTMNGKTFYLSISFDGTVDNAASIHLSKTAPAGATTGTSPSGSDRWGLGNAAQPSNWNVGAGGAATYPYWFNTLLTTTGDFVHFSQRGGTNNNYSGPQCGAMVVCPVSCAAADLFPVYTWKGQTDTQPGWTNATPMTNFTNPGRSGVDGTLAGWSVNITQPATIGAATYALDTLTNSLLAMPCNIVASNAAGWHARGRLPDIGFISFVGGSVPTRSGFVVRDPTTKAVKFVSIGNLLLPMNAVPIVY